MTDEHVCTVCGLPLAVGDWPCVTTIRPHGKSVQTNAFAAYFDIGLGMEITNLGDRHAAMRPEGTQVYRTRDGQEIGTEGRGRLEYRDKMSPGDLSARTDRVMARRKEEGLPT